MTVIATGFERTGVPRRTIERPTANNSRPMPRTQSAAGNSNNNNVSVSAEVPAAPAQRGAELSEFQARSFNPDDLDIPAFLRRR